MIGKSPLTSYMDSPKDYTYDPVAT